MTLADDLKPVVYAGRALAGEYGFRVHTVAILNEHFDALHDNSEFAGANLQPLVEANGQPPKVVWKKNDAVGFGNAMEDIVEVGPITPAFAGGGTDLTDLMGTLASGQVRHLVITGPKVPDGARYRIIDVRAERALRYMITAQAESEALKGL